MELSNIEYERGTSRILKNFDVKDYYRSVFDEWDENKDGFISISELEHLILSHEHIHLSKDSIRKLYEIFDNNGDALLDFEEFLVMINNPSFKNTFQNIAQRYLKFVILPHCRPTIKLRRTLTATGAYEKEIKCKTYTFGMILISAIQVILFHTNKSLADDDDDHGPIRKYLRFDPCHKKEFYRFFTYALVHKDHMHVYMNVAFQLLMGVPLEMVHSWRIILIYIVGVFGGSMMQSVFATYNMVGASAGVYSFYTAHVATVLLNWREMSHPVITVLLFGVILAFDLVYKLIVTYWFSESSEGDTSYLGHLGGAVTGLLLGVIILRNLKVTKKEIVLWYICLVAFIVYFAVLIILDVHQTVSGKACKYH